MVVITYTPDQVRKEDLIRCNVCETQIGFIKDHLDNAQNGRIEIFNNVFNVHIVDNINYVRHVNGNIIADVYCARCGMMLELKLISVPRPSLEISEGRFLIDLVKLVYWNDYPMIYQEQGRSAASINHVLYELGGGQIILAQQNGLASVGPAQMDEDEEAVDQIADGMGNLDLNQHM